MKKSEILLVVVLVIFGLAYWAVEKGKVQLKGEFSFYSSDRRLQGGQFSEFPEPEKVFPGVARIVIDNPAGEVLVDRSADDQVRLVSLLRVYYSRPGEVDEYRKGTTVRADLSDGSLSVSVRRPGAFPYGHLRVLHRLQVPGDVSLQVSNQEGATIIRDVGGSLKVDQKNGSLVLENTLSRAELRLQHCQATLRNLAAHAEINAQHAEVLVEKAASLRLNARHSDCSLKDVEKDAVVDILNGKLSLDGIGRLEVAARISRISGRDIRDGAVVSNKLESVRLENVAGDIRLSCRLSPIRLRAVSARNVVIENAYADIDLSEFSAEKLDILLKNGNLDLSTDRVTERINIESRYAELKLLLKNLVDPTFSIKARHGRIIAPASLGLDMFEEKSENFANRSGGTPEILVSSTYGNVHLDTGG